MVSPIAQSVNPSIDRSADAADAANPADQAKKGGRVQVPDGLVYL
jgi:hypothetical protein